MKVFLGMVSSLNRYAKLFTECPGAESNHRHRELKNVVERAVYRSENPDEPIDQIIFDPFESPNCVHLDANVIATDQDINIEPAPGFANFGCSASQRAPTEFVREP